MLIDIIVYSDEAAVGIVLLNTLEVYGVSFIRQYEKKIDEGILKEFGDECYWLINDPEITKYLQDKYKSGDVFNLEDALYIAFLLKKYCKGMSINQLQEQDYNYAELAKYSDTDFVTFLFYSLMHNDENLKNCMSDESLATQRFELAKILYERKTPEGFCYLSEFYYLGYGTKNLKKRLLNC